MTYEVIARKYRPQSFDNVIGQEHIVTTIANSISQNRIHHAYLFSGSRGTGKTTMARLLAKALNCSCGPTAKLCQKCDACIGISNGSFVDVQEIDGASNRGIDEIRNLRENVKFAPVAGKYKIYIIDEAHQITGAAFNALLKTLEEPPRHAVFILATTESQSIPQTIASRCQKYNFRLIPTKEIDESLKKILGSEKITADSDAIRLIAEAASGSMRDAQSLLDQAISFCDKKITSEKVKELLGVLPEEYIDETFSALANSSSKKIIGCLNKIAASGHDLSLFISEMLFFLRQLLLVKTEIESDLAESQKKIVDKFKDKFSVEQILRFSKVLLKAKEEMRWSDDMKFLLEIYLVKLTQPFIDSETLANMLKKETPISISAIKTNDTTAQPQRGRSCSDEPASFWRGFIASLPSSEVRLKHVLENTKLKKIEGPSLEIEVDSDFTLAEMNSKKDIILKLLHKYSGKNLTAVCALSKRNSAVVLEPNVPKGTENSNNIFSEPPPSRTEVKSTPSRLAGEGVKPQHIESIKKILDVFDTDKIERIPH